jgi:hypothetical protein
MVKPSPAPRPESRVKNRTLKTPPLGGATRIVADVATPLFTAETG